MLRTCLAILTGLVLAFALWGDEETCACPAMAAADAAAASETTSPARDSGADAPVVDAIRDGAAQRAAPTHNASAALAYSEAGTATKGEDHDASRCTCPQARAGEGCGCECVGSPLSASGAPALLSRSATPDERWHLQPGPEAPRSASIDWTPQPVLLDAKLAARPPPDETQILRAGPRLHLQNRQLLI